MTAWRAALTQRDRLFQVYCEAFGKVENMAEDDRELLDKAFPNEAELNVLQSGVKKIGRAEILAYDHSFLRSFLSFIQSTNYMKIFGLPDDLRDALQVLMCERTFLVQLVKGLIEKLLPSLLEDPKRHQILLAQPKFFNDPFLEK